MPKIISEEEKTLTKEAMQHACISLIKSKGLRNVTVDDITKTIGMAKGSFYYYYANKETLIFETIKISEKKIFDAIMGIRFDAKNFRETLTKALHSIYLAEDSIALYLKPEDFEYLMRKAPAELREQEDAKARNYLAQAGEMFNLKEDDRGVLAYLMNALQFLASNDQDFGKANKQRSLKILVGVIADFLSEHAVKAD